MPAFIVRQPSGGSALRDGSAVRDWPVIAGSFPGLRDLLPGIAALLQAQWTINPPATVLHDVRIFGSTDPTYGTVGWLPPQDGSPFAVLFVESAADGIIETNRIWATYALRIFLGIEHADTPSVNENYNDRAVAWMESGRQVIAANRRVGQLGATLFPTSGDTRWEMHAAKILNHFALHGTPWYGVEIESKLTITISVQFQA